jgi:hypothetical protein
VRTGAFWVTLAPMKRLVCILAVSACLVSLSAAPAAVSAPSANEDPVVAAISALRTSAELARLGKARGDGWALAMAARIRRATPVTTIRRAPEGGEAEAAPDPSDAWLAEARRLGRYDPELRGFVDIVQRQLFRGRTGGPKVSTALVQPQATHAYRERFQPGRAAAVYVEGDGDTDLSLRVRSADGASACISDGPGDVKLCSWTPRGPGEFTIEVSNRGPVRNRYALATN